jgi:hypothetical protein
MVFAMEIIPPVNPKQLYLQCLTSLWANEWE